MKTPRNTKRVERVRGAEEPLVIEVTESQFVYDNSEDITQRVDMKAYAEAKDWTPVMEPTAECPFCLRNVIFRWIWGDYRFTLHAEAVDTETMGEMPSQEECPGSYRPVCNPIRATRQPLFLKEPAF